MKQKKKQSKTRLWLVPNKHNAHHPHILRKHGLIAIALVLIVLQFAYNVTVAGKPKILGYATNVSSQAVTAEINASRKSQGLSSLSPDTQLENAASLKADDMFKNSYWSHNAPDGSQPWRWFDAAGYKYQLAGENLAKNFRTSDGVTSAWIDSVTHRKNMFNPNFKNLGVAVVNGTLNGEDTTLVVALFGARQADSAAPKNGRITSTTSSFSSNILANPAQISSLVNPISITTLAILIGLLAIALLTHWHYIKLPKKVRKAWYQHHALYTAAIALLAISYVTYIFTSGSI